MNLRPTNLISSERVQASIRARFNPIPLLTPQSLNLYLDLFRRGFFRDVAIVWDAIERRDYKVQAVAAKRKKSVARHGWEILTLDDSPAAQQQKLALEYFYNHLTASNVLEENETGGLSLLIRQMMDSIGKRYVVHEIVWQPDTATTGRVASAPFDIRMRRDAPEVLGRTRLRLNKQKPTPAVEQLDLVSYSETNLLYNFNTI